MASGDTAALQQQREGRWGGGRSPELRMFSILEGCDFSPTAWSFQSKWQGCVCVWVQHVSVALALSHAHTLTQRVAKKPFNQSLCLRLHTHIHQVWQCILHIAHPDRFIMGGEPMPHIPHQPSIGQTPVALNLHWEPLHLKMEVRSLSPWHIGSERDQPAVLKSFSLAALQHPTPMYSLDLVFQKPSFVLFFLFFNYLVQF